MCWHGYLSGVRCIYDLHMVQLMPLTPLSSCFNEIQNGLTFWFQLIQVVLGKRLLGVCLAIAFRLDYLIEALQTYSVFIKFCWCVL